MAGVSSGMLHLINRTLFCFIVSEEVLKIQNQLGEPSGKSFIYWLNWIGLASVYFSIEVTRFLAPERHGNIYFPCKILLKNLLHFLGSYFEETTSVLKVSNLTF